MDELGSKVSQFLNRGDGGREDKASGGVGMSCRAGVIPLNAQRGEGWMGRSKAGFWPRRRLARSRGVGGEHTSENTGAARGPPLALQPFTRSEIIGFTVGSVSSVLYLCSRVPQIYTNVSAAP